MKKLLVTASCLLLFGCSSGGAHPAPAASSAGSAASVDKAEANRRFARCMREHGVDMPDPGPDGNLQFDGGAVGDRSKAVQAASACQQYLPNGGELKNLSPQQLDQARAFAKCMREHGIDMPDPDPDGGLGAILGSGIDFDSPAFKAATEACRPAVQR